MAGRREGDGGVGGGSHGAGAGIRTQFAEASRPGWWIVVGYAAAAIEAAKAGAAVAHIHARDPKTGKNSRDPKLFREIVDRIRESGTDVVLNLTGGNGGMVTPSGQARVARAGADLTIGTYSAMVWKALEAAEEIAQQDGASIEVLDLRSLVPMDDDAIMRSVKKTNKVLIVHEETRAGGVGGEIAARINEQAFEWLDGPILRVTAHDTPLPYSAPLEDYVLPQTPDIVTAARRLLAY